MSSEGFVGFGGFVVSCGLYGRGIFCHLKMAFALLLYWFFRICLFCILFLCFGILGFLVYSVDFVLVILHFRSFSLQRFIQILLSRDPPWNFQGAKGRRTHTSECLKPAQKNKHFLFLRQDKVLSAVNFCFTTTFKLSLNDLISSAFVVNSYANGLLDIKRRFA